MSDTTLQFDLLAKDSASAKFRDLAASAAVAAGEIQAVFEDPVNVKIDSSGWTEYLAKLEAVKAEQDLTVGEMSASSMKLVEGANRASDELDAMWEDMRLDAIDAKTRIDAAADTLKRFGTEWSQSSGFFSRARIALFGMKEDTDELGDSADVTTGKFDHLFTRIRSFDQVNLGDGKKHGNGGNGGEGFLDKLFKDAKFGGSAIGGSLGAPVALGLGGLASGLTSAAGAGGILGGSIFGQIEGYVKLKTAITTARSTLAGMTSTSTGYAAAQKNLSSLLREQSHQYGPLVSGLHGVSRAWDDFLGKTRGPDMKLIGTVLKIAADALKQFAPVARHAARALEPLMKAMDKWVKGPDFEKMLHFFSGDGAHALAEFVKFLGHLSDGFLHLMEHLAPVAKAMGEFFAKLNGAQIGGGLTVLLGVVGLVTAAMGNLLIAIPALAIAFAVGFAEIWQHSAAFRDVVTKAFHQVSTAMSGLVSAAGRFWAKWGADITKYGIDILVGAVKIIGDVLSAILHVVTAILDALTGNWKGAWNQIKDAGKAIWDAIKVLAEAFGAALEALFDLTWNGIKAGARGAWAGIKALLSVTWDGIKDLASSTFGAVQSVIDDVWNAIKSVSQSAWQAIKAVISTAWNAIKSVVENGAHAVSSTVSNLAHSIVGFFAGIPGEMAGIGAAIINGLIGGIKSMIGPLVGVLHDVTSLIPKHKGPIEKDKQLLEPAGKAIMDGLVNGIKSRRARLTAELASVTKEVSTIGTSITTAASFASSFGANIFSAGITGGGSKTSLVNGQILTTSIPGNAGVVAGMLAQEKSQLASDQALRVAMTALSSKGLSKSLMAQLVSSGSSGDSEILALASASASTVREFNRLNASDQTALGNAGATSQGYRSMAAMKKRQANERATEKAIRRALKGLSVTVHHSKLRVTA